MENYSFSENIFFNRTKVFAKRMNCSRHIARADDNTKVICSQSSQSKTLNFFLLGQISLSASSKRDLGTRLSLAASLAFLVTDSVPD